MQLDQTPRRVVSLVPSITELAHDLGFEVIGKTKFCIHPERLESAKVVGGTKNVKTQLVRELAPDLILANKEENTQECVEELIEAGFPVYVSDVSTVDQSLDLIEKIGQIGGFEQEAVRLKKEIDEGFDSIEKVKPIPRVLYLIWKKPYMAAGTDTYISDILTHLGIENALTSWLDEGLRYPEISNDQIKSLNPDFILLSSEPFPFKEDHREKMEMEFGIPTLLVDGEAFSWYGSRQAKSIDYLKEFSRLLGNREKN